MSDNPDNGMAEDEKKTDALLALLYPEPGNSPVVASYDDLAEIEELRRVRALFREMPDEEPSAAVSNKLLALAAQHAPAKKSDPEEQKGFFARLTDLFLPLAYHPGLAAAASLLLVAGLAGTLYVSGKSQVAEPVARSNAPRPEAATFADKSLQNAPTPSDSAAPAAGAPARGADIAKPKPAQSRRQPAPKKTSDVTVSRSSDARKLGAKEVEKDASKPTIVSPGQGSQGKAAGPTPAPSPARKRRPVAPDFSQDSPSGESLSPPPPASRDRSDKRPAPSPAEGESGDDLVASEEPESSPAPQDPSAQAAKLHKQAIRAAKKGQCAKVKSIGQKIRKLSSAYYDRSFLSDQKLKACLAPPKKS